MGKDKCAEKRKWGYFRSVSDSSGGLKIHLRGIDNAPSTHPSAPVRAPSAPVRVGVNVGAVVVCVMVVVALVGVVVVVVVKWRCGG